MLRLAYQPYTLHFTFEAGTSRGILTEKETYFIKIFDDKHPQTFGLGECSVLKKLSIDDVPATIYEAQLQKTATRLADIHTLSDVRKVVPDDFPSIQFGVETAWLDFQNGGNRRIFDSDFRAGVSGIPINGLIWMGTPGFMEQQIAEKLSQGYTTLKLKIGAIDFVQEIKLLESIRKQFSPDQIALRVDANGAFSVADAMEKLSVLAQFQLHSIEQPIRQGQPEAMTTLCRHTTLPIALDEELIGIADFAEKKALLTFIQPQYIILKPSLLGGITHCKEWIQLAESQGIGWWITSALESNIGLNAIAQFTATLQNPLPQGLGTGQLYDNNIPSPLHISNGYLWHNPEKNALSQFSF